MSQRDLEKRIQTEKTIARKVVKAALAAGYQLSVYNGGEAAEISHSTSEKAIIAEMFATDDEYLFFYKPEEPKKRVGWVKFVYGNDGWDVVSDYTMSLEDLLKPINEYANKIAA